MDSFYSTVTISLSIKNNTQPLENFSFNRLYSDDDILSSTPPLLPSHSRKHTHEIGKNTSKWLPYLTLL